MLDPGRFILIESVNTDVLNKVLCFVLKLYSTAGIKFHKSSLLNGHDFIFFYGLFSKTQHFLKLNKVFALSLQIRYQVPNVSNGFRFYNWIMSKPEKSVEIANSI